SERSISVPSKPPAEKVGANWEAAANLPKDQQPAKFAQINNSIRDLASDATKGMTDPVEKQKAIGNLEASLNSPIKMFGGPSLELSPDGKNLTISNFRKATDDEVKGK